MQALSFVAKKSVESFAKEYGIPKELVLNAVFEYVIPRLDPAQVAFVIDRCQYLSWMRLEIGQSTQLDMGVLGEPLLRSRIRRFSKATGQKLKTSRVELTVIKITRVR